MAAGRPVQQPQVSRTLGMRLPVLVALALRLVPQVAADIDNKFPPVYVTNPVARHGACRVQGVEPTVCVLYGYEEASNETLQFMITGLPSRGKLYDTSQNYRTHGTNPKQAPQAIEEWDLPFVLSDLLDPRQSRVVYVPEDGAVVPDGQWAHFTYAVQVPAGPLGQPAGPMSEPGVVALTNEAYAIANSSFYEGEDGWGTEGNIHTAMPTWDAFGTGILNRFIYSIDEVHFIDFTTWSDRSKWYFVAPASKFCVPGLAGSYGGTLQFTAISTAGNFSRLNSPLDWITLECANCNGGRGMRIVRFADNGLEWDGSEKVVAVTLAAGHGWKRDPMNAALPYTDATACEIAAVLAGTTKFKILGDFCQAGETVAIDDVSITSATLQPQSPLACQQGCSCAHLASDQRFSCCGSDASLYFPTFFSN